MKMRIAFVALAAAALGLAGCKNDQKTTSTESKPAAATTKTAAAKPVNKTCPISGEPVSASAETVSYQGKTVGFCCDHCEDKWSKLSDADKAAKLAAASK